MRTLVTGGAGFIGSSLVDALIARGDAVAAFDDLSTGSRDNLAAALAGGARLIEGDVTSRADLEAAIAVDPPEQVFHLAAQTDVRKSVADPAFDLAVNALGTVNVLEAAVAAGAKRVLLASTGGVIYGEGEGRELPLPEGSERLAEAHYGVSKLAAEAYLDLYRRLHGLSGAALRLGNVYGPRQSHGGEAGVVAIFCDALLAGTRPTVFGDGLQTRDYVHVDDAVAAFLAASGTDAGGAFNIGTGRETTVLEVGRMIAAELGVEFNPLIAPSRAGEVQHIAIAGDRAASELGWRAETPLAEGLAATARWARGVGAQLR